MGVINKVGVSFPYKTWNLTEEKKIIQAIITKHYEFYGRKITNAVEMARGHNRIRFQGRDL